VGKLRQRDAQHGNGACERDDDGNHHGKPRPADKDLGDHRPALPVGAGSWAAAGAGDTAWPGRTRWMPSTMTFSPSLRPLSTAAYAGVDWPSLMRRCMALLSAPTT